MYFAQMMSQDISLLKYNSPRYDISLLKYNSPRYDISLLKYNFPRYDIFLLKYNPSRYDGNNEFFFDRDPRSVAAMLNFYRIGKLHWWPNNLLISIWWWSWYFHLSKGDYDDGDDFGIFTSQKVIMMMVMILVFSPLTRWLWWFWWLIFSALKRWL